MTQIYNFSAGPAMMPKAVLAQAQAELLNWQNQGTSVMEVSHRGKYFSELHNQIKISVSFITFQITTRFYSCKAAHADNLRQFQ